MCLHIAGMVRTWRNLFAAPLILASATLVACRSGGGGFPPSLASQANEICADTQTDLGTRPPLPSSPSFEQRAARVESLSDAFEGLTSKLRALQNVGITPSFDDWLATWSRFIEIGRTYAVAIRSGDPAVYEPAGNLGDPLAVELNRTARENAMPDCIF